DVGPQVVRQAHVGGGPHRDLAVLLAQRAALDWLALVVGVDVVEHARLVVLPYLLAVLVDEDLLRNEQPGGLDRDAEVEVLDQRRCLLAVVALLALHRILARAAAGDRGRPGETGRRGRGDRLVVVGALRGVVLDDLAAGVRQPRGRDDAHA